MEVFGNKKKMNLDNIQFITHQNSKYNYLDSALLALKGGIRFIQLRIKNKTENEIILIGKELKTLCDKYNAKLIIDDYVELVKEIGACGVHLGKNDMPINKARKILGNDKIIGGTANCFEDILIHYNNGADYIGLGPFRFTTTKDNLSPILGIDGYNRIVKECKKNNINIPIYAIGGIRLDDLKSLKETNVFGLAISSIILDSSNPIETTKEIINNWK